MSEQLPIIIAPSPQPSTSKAPSVSSNDDVSNGKQRGFGGVLSDQVHKQDGDKSSKSSDKQSLSAKSVSKTADANAEVALPQDGNELPIDPELLELANSSEDNTELLIADTPIVDPELITEEVDAVAIATPVIVADSKPVVAATLKAGNEKSEAPVAKLVSTPAAAVSTIAGEASDDSAQAEVANQLRRVESLEGKVISLAARGDVDKTPFQTNKIIEQFTDLSARPTTAVNNISAQIPAVSPVSTSSATSTSATGLQQVSIEVPVQDQKWQKVFAERVVWSVGNNQSVQVRVNPAELGPIDIQLKMNKEQTNITFNTTHATTRDTIESALPRLREMLASEGLELGDVDVRHNDTSAQERNASQDQDTGRESGLGNQEELAENETEILLHPVMISERVVDYYI